MDTLQFIGETRGPGPAQPFEVYNPDEIKRFCPKRFSMDVMQ